MSKTLATLVSKASTQIASLQTSEVGQLTRRPPSVSSATRGSSGSNGAAVRPTSTAGLPALLAKGDPEETDKTLEASLRQLLGSFPEATMRANYHDVYGFDLVFDSYPPLRPKEPLQLTAAQHLVRLALCPASAVDITKELARVRIGTAGRAIGDEDMEAWLLVFGDELGQFPLDVVRDCCRRWVRREKWTPTLAEIRDDCQRMVRRRQAMLRTLQEAP